ncbi:hypothetical protein DV737_g1575, partial [Chaetothyriales sp. CBS 132003]
MTAIDNFELQRSDQGLGGTCLASGSVIEKAERRGGSSIRTILKLFTLSNTNTPTVPPGDEEVPVDGDEPPDDQLTALCSSRPRRGPAYPKSIQNIASIRRESLLTKAIWQDSHPDLAHISAQFPARSGGVSIASSHSTASVGDLTSDGGVSSDRSLTPSPPLPARMMLDLSAKHLSTATVVIAPVTQDDKPPVAVVGEAAIEKSLGRKRCIMFASGAQTPPKEYKPSPGKNEPAAPAEPAKRRPALTFACPSRQDNSVPSAKPTAKAASSHGKIADSSEERAAAAEESGQDEGALSSSPQPRPFPDFANADDETDSWVDQPVDASRKLTLNECMKKENAIRQTCTQAEEEADEEEREQEELENAADEDDDTTHEDDFAPSDEDSDDGNESDDEGGFADSDDESDGGSDYQFWKPAPSTTTVATSPDNVTMSHFSSRGRLRTSSMESDKHSSSPRAPTALRRMKTAKATKIPKMRPGTPELPDSTDFVCGTFDEDRPLEAAYISCREQKKRAKHDQFADFDKKEGRGRANSQRTRPVVPPPTSQAKKKNEMTLPSVRRSALTNRSPAPPRKLFGHSPTRLRSPAPQVKLRSPPASPSAVPINLTISRLAQRPLGGQPGRQRTASLPRTPNPFFRNFNVGSPSISNVASGAVTPAVEEAPRPDLHVRGPVDIVMGLEKKRQKRKEKFWRQHCRKQAKEQAERRPVPGRGAERMRELGLECAERNRGYGLGHPQLVLSL